MKSQNKVSCPGNLLMKLSASVLFPVCTRYFRNWVWNNKEIIVKLQRTCTDCSHASSFNEYLQRSSGVFISEEALWSHFLSSTLFLMCWSSSDSKHSHLRLQASYQITSESLAIVFNEFWMKLFIRHSSFILESYSCLLSLRCYVPAYFFPMSPFSSHIVFAYNFLPIASCHPRHFSPRRLLFSISPAFLYLFQTDSSARQLSFMYLAFKLYFWMDQVQRAGMLLIAKWCIKPMT